MLFVNTRDKVVSKKNNACSAACFYFNVVPIQVNIHFSRIILTAKFHSIHVHYHSKYSIAKMANMIDLYPIFWPSIYFQQLIM